MFYNMLQGGGIFACNISQVSSGGRIRLGLRPRPSFLVDLAALREPQKALLYAPFRQFIPIATVFL